MRENMIYDTKEYQIREGILERMLEIIHNQRKVDTLFFGDSITQYLDIKKYFGIDAANCGIVGITSDMLLHFVDEGVIKYQPKNVFIMIGTNDLGNTTMTSPREIALNVKEMVEIIHNNLTDCHIYLISCIPCIETLHGYKYIHKGFRCNDLLKRIMQEDKKMIFFSYVSFIDVFSSLLNEENPIEACYIDGLHLTDQGYSLYTSAIKKYLETL